MTQPTSIPTRPTETVPPPAVVPSPTDVPSPTLPLPDRLDAIATRPSPPSAVNVSLAMADGRRFKRKRQFGVMSWSIVGLLVLSLGALATAHSARSTLTLASSAPNVGTGTGSSAAAGPSSNQSSEEFGPAASSADGSVRAAPSLDSTDPFTVGAKFGWLPSGFASTKATLTNDAVTLVASSSPLASGASDTISLSTFPVGWSEQTILDAIGSGAIATTAPTPTSFPTPVSSPTPVEAINGHAAYQVRSSPTRAATRATTLLWQLADATWAQIEAQFPVATPAADEESELRHVAETVVPDPTPLALPMHITGLPSYATANILEVAYPTTVTNAAWSVEVGLIVDRAYLVYDIGPAGRATPTFATDPRACVMQNGIEGCVTFVSGELSSSLQNAGGVQALARAITLRGPSPSTWTTDVFAAK